VGGLAFTWLPNGDYEPIRKGEKGTLTEGIAAIAKAPTGRPSLVSAQRAADEGRLEVAPGERLPVTTVAPAVSGTTTTARGQQPSQSTTVPARGSTTVAPSTTEPRATTTTVRATTTTAG